MSAYSLASISLSLCVNEQFIRWFNEFVSSTGKSYSSEAKRFLNHAWCWWIAVAERRSWICVRKMQRNVWWAIISTMNSSNLYVFWMILLTRSGWSTQFMCWNVTGNDFHSTLSFIPIQSTSQTMDFCIINWSQKS